MLIDRFGVRFEAFLDPATAVGIGYMHELGADGAGVDAAGLVGSFPLNVELRDGDRGQVLP